MKTTKTKTAYKEVVKITDKGSLHLKENGDMVSGILNSLDRAALVDLSAHIDKVYVKAHGVVMIRLGTQDEKFWTHSLLCEMIDNNLSERDAKEKATGAAVPIPEDQ